MIEKMDKNIAVYEMSKTSFLVANAEAPLRHFFTCSMALSVLLTIMRKIFINL